MWQDTGVQLGAVDSSAPLSGSPQYNKLGGKPDWPGLIDIKFETNCPVCRLKRPLVLQCYAPLEGSPLHRTLYIFACVNPNCWNNSESWTCLKVGFRDEEKHEVTPIVSVPPPVTFNEESWCTAADAWGEDVLNGNDVEEPNIPSSDVVEKSIEDTTTGHMMCDDDVSSHLEDLTLSATADIEVSMEQISIDSPALPQCDLNAMINKKPEIPLELKNDDSKFVIHFDCMYIRVYSEFISSNPDSHITELIQKYREEQEDVLDIQNPIKNKSKKKQSESFVDEEYEKSVPLHGDIAFHSFLSRIRENPDQIIRYHLGGEPLLSAPLPCDIKNVRCKNCAGEVQFELQILPTMIPLLKIPGNQDTFLEFGNVLVFMCKKDCVVLNSTYVEETVIVQRES